MRVRGSDGSRITQVGQCPKTAGWFLAVGILGIVAYYLLPLADAVVRTGLTQGVVYTVISVAGVAAVLVGVVKHRPQQPLPWFVLAGAQCSYTIGDVLDFVIYQIQHADAYPTIADFFYLLGYPLFGWALVILVRSRAPGWQLATLIDAAIMAVSLGLLGWVYVIEPMTAVSGAGFAAKATSVAYPLMDLLVLSMVLRLTLGAGGRSAAFHLLLGSFVAMLVGDVVYAVQSQRDTWRDGTWVDGVWLVEYLLLGVAALHPSMRRLDTRAIVSPPQATLARIMVLAAASLTGPVVLVLQEVRGAPVHVVVVALACAVLSLLGLARMAELAANQRWTANTDALTGLRSRRFFCQTLQTQSGRAARGHYQLGVLLLDIDHFKQINDAHGHPAGDRVLREIAERIEAATRPGDVVARYGGEEFVVLLDRVDEALTVSIAERVRLAVGGAPVRIGDVERTITVSIGAVVLPGRASTADEVIHLADQALYAAKHAGRNQVVTAWRPASVVR